VPRICGECGQVVHKKPEYLLAAPLGPVTRSMLDALINRFPHPVPGESLADAMYSHDIDGGPETALGNVRKYAYRLRNKIKGYGWTVTGHKGGDGYRLERIGD